MRMNMGIAFIPEMNKLPLCALPNKDILPFVLTLRMVFDKEKT